MNSGNWTKPLTTSRTSQLSALFVFGLASLLSTGCDKKGGGTDNAVSGKITLDGKAVAGSVVFYAADNKEFSGLLLPDGTYTVTDMPAGDYKVAVKPTGGAAPKGAAIDMSGGAGGVAPPAKYGSTTTSGLTFKRTTGKQEHNIPLTP